jgi:hypothetical protein
VVRFLIKLVIGSGEKVFHLYDNCHPEGPLFENRVIFEVASNQNAKVSSIIRGDLGIVPIRKKQS